MSVDQFNVKEQWLGTSSINQYTFDFTIQDLSHLLIYIQDNNGILTETLRGTDTSFLSGVTFDPDLGGGVITLQANLQRDFVMTILLANDTPTQPSEFKDKGSFTLELFELALDYIVTALQRVAYIAQRSFVLHDLDDTDNINTTLPMGFGNNPGASLCINQNANGIVYGPTMDQIVEAEDFANAAAASAAATAAGVSAAAASALAAAAAASAAVAAEAALAIIAATLNGFTHTGPFAVIAPNANANLLAELTNSANFTEVDYIARVQRGTTTYARQEFTIFFRNGAWEIAIGPDRYADAAIDHGVTFTVDAVTGQINAAVANDGGSNAKIDLFKISWAV